MRLVDKFEKITSSKCEKIVYEDIMKSVTFTKLKIKPQLPPEGFEGW